MNASQMARRRWLGVSSEQRTKLASIAALARWASATEKDREAARDRVAKARSVRARIVAARFLGVDPSELSEISVKTISPSKFRHRKDHEQQLYWDNLRQQTQSHARPTA